MIRQAAILCGGLGTRLGELTRTTPKPLLTVAGKPFLEILIGELSRHGAKSILLLSSFESAQVQAFADDFMTRFPQISIQLSLEPGQAGTGGALWHAQHLLEDTFFVLNGDSWFDCPVLELANLLGGSEGALGALALRRMPSTPRYGEVHQNAEFITRFSASGSDQGTMLVNGGVYALRKAFVDQLAPICSLEHDVLPRAAEQGQLRGLVSDGEFIDIGVPNDFALAQLEVNRRLTKPALFLDRDGVLNVDHGHVGSIERFEWIPGAREAVLAANRAGYYVFVVTNQAGIAKGFYAEEDYLALMNSVAVELAEIGAHLDDIRHCPFHKEATVERYRAISGWRKPGPGMLNDLIRAWPLDLERSLLIGDKDSDIQAANQVGIAGHLFKGGNLESFLRPLIVASSKNETQ